MRQRSPIVGKWILNDKRMQLDAEGRRIEDLIKVSFRKVADRESGWVVLYFDEEEKEFWELSFPESELHGGGPPRLDPIETETVRQRYPPDIVKRIVNG